MATDPSRAADRAPRLAVLIDAENASPRIAEALFTEIATLGEASARRIYGDFASAQIQGWTRVLARFAIQPQQNFANTKGKNSGDIALVIDAMDLLHSGRFDGFCLVSSDADFTRLASRIREEGVDVYGFGERKTPESFRQACTRFIYTENLTGRAVSDNDDEPAAAAAAGSARGRKSDVTAAPAEPGATPAPGKRPPSEAARLIASVIADMDDDGAGWVNAGGIANRLRNAYPDFDQRSYGYAKLSDLIRATGRFEVETSAGGAMRVRDRA
ncbi:NYN domain-containing protein [Brevundimonas sp.]|uniref:NYN domain-containing protein n=1 Tax=Brevundimonas sp. TaxID=1871086 RepID=UPI002D60F5F7|nr:NYN domain-containing protein [Brevundimonas sp.]HYD27509.1 NYN domain-containing protein [Brevundimonas sp.]